MSRAWLAAGLAAGGWLAWRAIRTWRGFDFNGKTVLITGGSRGLGLVLARQLAGAGAHLLLCARDPDELAEARRELRDRGATVHTYPCDLSHPAEVDAMVYEIAAVWGGVDVLINNAGVIEVGPFESMAREDFEEAMNVNFWGALNTILAVLPGMRERQQGRIVNISSIGGKISVPHLVPYSASKFALTGLSEGLRAELRPLGIVVTTVCPGLMRTGSPRNAIFKGRHRAEYAWFSISDALPLLSISAESAARQIIAACARGDAEVILSLPARIAASVHGLFPGVTADLLGLFNRFLPGPGGIGKARAKGSESESALSPSWATRLGDLAAARNNE